MENLFSPFPLYFQGIGSSSDVCRRQGWEPVPYKVYSPQDAVPSFFITYTNKFRNGEYAGVLETEDVCFLEIEVFNDKTKARVEWIESNRIPWKTVRDSAYTYLLYSGEAIASLELPVGVPLYLKIGDYLSNTFYACDSSKLCFLEASSSKKIGDVPYHAGFVARIGVNAQLGDPVPTTFQTREADERNGDRVTFEKLGENYVLDLIQSPGFLSQFINSLRSADEVKAQRRGEWLTFKGIDLSTTTTLTRNDQSTITLTLSRTTYQWSDCETDETVTLICSEEGREYAEDDYSSTDYK